MHILMCLFVILAILLAYVAAYLNTSLPRKEKPHSTAPILVCIGDSITFGAGVHWTRHRDSWERYLEPQLKGAYQVLNYGISGATLQNEGDIPYRKGNRFYGAGFWDAAKALKPDAVLLMLGTNDSKPLNWNKEKYEEQLSQMIQEIKTWEKTKRIVLMTPPFTTPAVGKQEVAFNIRNEIIRDEIVPIIKRLAEKHETELIDLYQVTNGHPEYFTDGVHPNKVGNRVIADTISSALQPQLTPLTM